MNYHVTNQRSQLYLLPALRRRAGLGASEGLRTLPDVQRLRWRRYLPQLSGRAAVHASQYYMPVFHGNLEFRGPLPQDPIARRASILENFFALYNRDDRPNPKTSRSMSVGDVVKLDGQFYLCAPTCFTQVDFKSVELNGPVARLVTPDGSTLEVSVFPNDDFPCINIDLLQKDGISERVCFVEHNPEKAPGHQLHIGVYCSTEEDTVYYDSYVRTEEKVYEV